MNEKLTGSGGYEPEILPTDSIPEPMKIINSRARRIKEVMEGAAMEHKETTAIDALRDTLVTQAKDLHKLRLRRDQLRIDLAKTEADIDFKEAEMKDAVAGLVDRQLRVPAATNGRKG